MRQSSPNRALRAEIRKPRRTIPWSIVVAIFAMATVYLAMQIGVLGVVDWHEMLNDSSPAYTSVDTLVLERSWGATAAKIVTIFILVTAFTSVFGGLHPIELSLAWLVLGLVAFGVWARARGQWPFGPLEVRERYVEADPALLDYDEEEVPDSAAGRSRPRGLISRARAQVSPPLDAVPSEMVGTERRCARLG